MTLVVASYDAEISSASPRAIASAARAQTRTARPRRSDARVPSRKMPAHAISAAARVYSPAVNASTETVRLRRRHAEKA
eukprot:2127941-Prymnesium_polylepis.1